MCIHIHTYTHTRTYMFLKIFQLDFPQKTLWFSFKHKLSTMASKTQIILAQQLRKKKKKLSLGVNYSFKRREKVQVTYRKLQLQL